MYIAPVKFINLTNILKYKIYFENCNIEEKNIKSIMTIHNVNVDLKSHTGLSQILYLREFQMECSINKYENIFFCVKSFSYNYKRRIDCFPI